MATYLELRNLMSDANFRNRLQAAVQVAAHEVMIDAGAFPTTTVDATLISDRLSWSARAINQPDQEAQKILPSVLAGARAFTAAQILAAPDEGANSLLDAVKLTVDLLAQYDKPVAQNPPA